MSTQPEFSKSTGPTSEGGEMLPRFLPTPSSTRYGSNRNYKNNRNPEGEPTDYRPSLDTMASTGMLTSSAVVSLASLFLLPVDGGVKMMSVGSGAKCVEFARYSDQHGCWLKTSQGYSQQRMFADNGEPCSEEWCETWPRSGMVSDGIAYRLPPLVPRISGTGCSYWGTPQAHERTQTPRTVDHGIQLLHILVAQGAKNRNLLLLVIVLVALLGAVYSKPPSRQGSFLLKEITRGALNADWVSILMGFPADWTVVEDGNAESPG